jgi:hypothetical protein
MTTKLEAVFKKAATLPVALQDSLAEGWLAELQDEELWNEKFAKSQHALEQMAKQAVDNYRAGKSVAKGWDKI